MKKTISVNLKGINFNIEEDAYDLLERYIDRLTNALKNVSGSKEILEDIELRIAELCSSKMSENKTVIEYEDINDILATLGDPSDYIEEGDLEEDEKVYAEATAEQGRDRRLFRDTENAVIGGVCQGISNFFNIDVVIVRVIFVVLFLFPGAGFLLYLILWISVPKAKSTIDRLRMQGKPITVETVKDEVKKTADNLKSSSQSFAAKIRNEDDHKRRLSKLGRVLAIVAGAMLILWGLSWLVSLLILIIGGAEFIPMLNEGGFMSMTEFGELILDTATDVNYAWIGGLMAAFSAILFVILLGSMFIFRLKTRWAKISLGGLFITGFIGSMICIYIGFKTGKDFTMEAELEDEIGQVDGKELTIIPKLNNATKVDRFEVKSHGRNGIMKLSDDEIQMYGVHMIYRRSKDTLFHIIQTYEARASSHDKAQRRAQNINHGMEMKGDSLYIETDYQFPRADKLRDQGVYVIVEIPDGARVIVGDDIIQFGKDEIDSKTKRKKEREMYSDKEAKLDGDGEHWKYY